MTDDITPIMGLPEILKLMAQFEIALVRGRIELSHIGCPWFYTFTDRTQPGMPKITPAEIITAAHVHSDQHQPDGIWCINAICSRHYGGLADIHQDTQ